MHDLPAPMLPTSGDLPAGDGWWYEPKWDGIRAVVRAGSRPAMRSRPGRDMTARFPEVAAAVRELPDCVLDGELIVCGQDGRPDFDAVRRRLAMRPGLRLDLEVSHRPATLVVFDVVEREGASWTRLPWEERRRGLDELGLGGPAVVSPVHRDGAALWAAVVEQRLEGVVAKRAGSPYRPGRRSADWVKVKNTCETEHVVVGVDRRGGHRVFLVAREAPDGGLDYAGRVDLVDRGARTDIEAALTPRASSPLGWRAGGVAWVEPDTRVVVRSLATGGLREARIVAVATRPGGR